MLNIYKLLCQCVCLICLLFFSQLTIAKTGQQRFTSEDFSHWLDAAYIAQASYESKENIKKALFRQGYEVTLSRQLEGYSVAYVLASNHKTRQHIIAIRGTSNIKNVVVDAAFVLVADKLSGINIHQGFLLSARDIYQQILPEIKPGYKINTVGHSLGGAAAIILAMMFDAQGYPIGEVITFGQPKVTNISGSRKFTQLDIKRLVTPLDIVPLVPPVDPMDLLNFSIFWHQGTEVVLYKDSRYSVLTGTDSMLRAADFLNDIPGEQHLTSHFMSTYISYIKTKLDSPVEIKYQSDFSFSDWFASPASPAKK